MFFRTILIMTAGLLAATHLQAEPFQPKHGAVCFTFDDGLYREWLPQMDLFKRYHAKATFFYSGKITREAAESMLVLRKNGHSIGLHTLQHKNCANTNLQQYFDTQIKPQLDAAGKYGVKNICYFAYPNNRHSPESDRFLSKYFARFRAGTKIRQPKGFWIAGQDAAYIPLKDIPKEKVLGGCGIGQYYLSTTENLDAALERAAKENKLIVFYSHGISPHATGVHMPQKLLEHLLKKANELQMSIIGFDQLPESTSRAKTPSTPTPTLSEVIKAEKELLKSDSSRDSVRNSDALKTMQYAIDHIAPGDFISFYQECSNIPQKNLDGIYKKHPLFHYYDAAFDKVLNDLKSEKPEKGKVTIFFLYNMGCIVKTEKHCFGIDVHHRRALELVPFLEFVVVTHNHSDHQFLPFLNAMNKAGKMIYSSFYPSLGGYSKEPERKITHGDLTIYSYESDHNKFLRKFVMPFEIICGKDADDCVIFTSGDSCNAKQLKHRSKKIDFHLVHPYVGLDVVEAAAKTVQGDVTLIGHLQEMHHRFDQWRWTYVQGYEAAEKIRAAGKKAWVPMWGEKIIWRKLNLE